MANIFEKALAGKELREAYLKKAEAELATLQEKGINLYGYAFSNVLIVKAENPELGEAVAQEKDVEAVRAALKALGYEPQDWALLTLPLNFSLSDEDLRLCIGTLDPHTIICVDDFSAIYLRECYVSELVMIDDLRVAMLEPLYPALIMGMRILNLGNFAEALEDAEQKQECWAALKWLRPYAEPY